MEIKCIAAKKSLLNGESAATKKKKRKKSRGSIVTSINLANLKFLNIWFSNFPYWNKSKILLWEIMRLEILN